MALKQPIGQKRLTNVAVVRLKKAGLRFEIACYKNKVSDWRNGIEKDLDEVLQTMSVFHNVSKGVMAKEKELKEAFGTTDEKTICLEILAKGELQVSDKERKMEYEHLFKDVAGVLVDKCVNPDTGRPYTLGLLERALREMHFAVDPKRSAKQQAMEALQLLRERFPIERARMRLKLSVPVEEEEAMRAEMENMGAVIENMEMNAKWACAIMQVEPVVFRQLSASLERGLGKGQGRLEVLSLAVTAGADSMEDFSTGPTTTPSGTSVNPYNAATTAVASTVPSAMTDWIGSTFNAMSVQETRERNQAQSIVHEEELAASNTDRLQSPKLMASPHSRPEPSRSGSATDIVYPRGPISGLPEAHASRRERFAELDSLQPGWQVELRAKGSTVEAVFFSPTGEDVGPYAKARRMALTSQH